MTPLRLAPLPVLLAACGGPGSLFSTGFWARGGACDPSQVLLTPAFEHLLAGTATECEIQAVEAFAARRRPEHGPWRQDIRVARSTDGVSFETVPGVTIRTAAGVPEARLLPDGRIYLWYVDGDLDHLVEKARTDPAWLRRHGLPGIGALRMAVSDDGITFEEVEEFGIDGLVPGMVVDPDVRVLPDGSWRMVYVAMPVLEFFERATWVRGEQHEVFVADSPDGIHWTQRDRALRGPFADPTVLCRSDLGPSARTDAVGGGCLLLSLGIDGSTSDAEGLPFQFNGQWGPPGFAPDFVLLPDGGVRLFYNDMAAFAPLRSIVSTDGVDWREEAGTRLPESYAEAVSVTQAPGGGWLLYYHTFREGDEAPFDVRWQTSHAFQQRAGLGSPNDPRPAADRVLGPDGVPREPPPPPP